MSNPFLGLPAVGSYCVGDGRVGYFGSQARKYPKAILPQMIKLRPDSVPLYPGHEEKSAYFHLGRQLLPISSKDSLRFCIMSDPMRRSHPGTRFMQRNLCWKFEFLNAALEVFQRSSWMRSLQRSTQSSNLGDRRIAGLFVAARLCRRLFGTPRSSSLGHYLEASMEQLEKHTSLKPFSWEPRKFFSFLMANSKGRFQTWIAPAACSYKRFLDWDFVVGISAIQGHSRVPEQVSEAAQGESNGLSIRATRKGWQRHRVAIHFTYAGGTESPGPGTVIRYGANTFYARLDYESFFKPRP